MDRRALYVCGLLLVLLAGQGEAIKCHVCVKEETSEMCAENGFIQDCDDLDADFDSCQTSIVTDTEGNPSISKSCAIKSACDLSVVPGQCTGLYEALSVCYCCCNDSDKCNFGLCGMAEEDQCVPKTSKKTSSKKTSSKKKSSKKKSSKKSKAGSKEGNMRRRRSKSKKSCESSGVALVVSPIFLLSILVMKL